MKKETLIEECLTLFETTACKETYDMKGGIIAVVDHILSKNKYTGLKDKQGNELWEGDLREIDGVLLNYSKDQFKNDEEYKKFLDEKWLELKKKLEQPEIKAVFKRLADR